MGYIGGVAFDFVIWSNLFQQPVSAKCGFCLSADTFTYSIPAVMAIEELPPIMVCSCWIKKQKEDKKTLSSNL